MTTPRSEEAELLAFAHDNAVGYGIESKLCVAYLAQATALATLKEDRDEWRSLCNEYADSLAGLRSSERPHDAEKNPRTPREQYLVNRITAALAVADEYERQLDESHAALAALRARVEELGADKAREATALRRIADQIDFEVRRGNDNFAQADALILRQAAESGPDMEALRPAVAYLVGAEHAPDCGERAEWVRSCTCGLAEAREAMASIRHALTLAARKPRRAALAPRQPATTQEDRS